MARDRQEQLLQPLTLRDREKLFMLIGRLVAFYDGQGANPAAGLHR